MTKILSILVIALFTITASAQEVKTTSKKEVQKEKECCLKASDSKAMTADEIAQHKAKCKAEGKKCDTKMTGTEEKKCCAKKA